METKVQEKTVRWEDLEVAPVEKKAVVRINYPSITDVSDEELEEARKALARDYKRMLMDGVLFAHGINAKEFAKAMKTAKESAEKASISLRDIAILSSEFPPMGTCTPCQIALTGNSNGD